MSDVMHAAAPHHLPVFITAPGETDVFLVGSAIFLVLAVIGLGSLYFRLHALPEHLAHGKATTLQFEIVAVLALLGLLLHNTMFWVAALLLAMVPIPDLYGPLAGMAESLAKMAGGRRRPSNIEVAPAPGTGELAPRANAATGAEAAEGGVVNSVSESSKHEADAPFEAASAKRQHAL